jgi:hypothetical protein
VLVAAADWALAAKPPEDMSLPPVALDRLDDVSRLTVKRETHLRTLDSGGVRLGHLAFALVRHLREGFVVLGVVLEWLSI